MLAMPDIACSMATEIPIRRLAKVVSRITQKYP
jgi:hypothetical protein